MIQCPRAKDGSDPPKGTVTIIDAGSSTDKYGFKSGDIRTYLAGVNLHLVVLTHADADHLNYMGAILRLADKNVDVYHPCKWNNYYKKHIKSNNVIPHEVRPCIGIKKCTQLNQLLLNLCPKSDVVKLAFVASAFKGCKKGKAHNEDSLIAKITYFGKTVLIAGDFELSGKTIMKQFLGKVGIDLQSDIYRLSHHGSYNNKANRPEFLKAVGASYVFSSSGFRYHHPRCEIYDYYYMGSGELEDADSHRYTCYRRLSNGKYKLENKNCKMAMYVTSIKRKMNNQWVKSFCVIKFDLEKKIFNNCAVSVNPIYHCFHFYE